MAKRFELKMFDMPVIMRHDYEDKEIAAKINEYRKRSVKAFSDFLTNVPGSDNFNTFLDVGAGDLHDVRYFAELNPNYEWTKGLDLYLDENDYNDYMLKGDWYYMADKGYIFENQYKKLPQIDAMYINHSLEHSANIYQTMNQVSKLQNKGSALFIAVPDGNSEFGYAITSSTTHFSVLTKGFLLTTLQRFGYNVIVEEREFRPGAPELWAFAIKQYDGFGD